MKRWFGLAAMVLAAALTAGASSAQAAKGAKKNADQQIHGKVLAMHHSKKGGVTMTVKVHHHHKKQAQPAVAAVALAGAPKHHHSHRTFQLTSATRVEAVHGKQRTATGVAAIHKGSHVTVMARGHHADKVSVHHAKKKA